MKTFALVFALVGVLACVTQSGAQPDSSRSATASAKVGVYDSRALAYAYFWSEAGTRKREALVAAARSAKAAGDTARFRELDAQIVDHQKRSHLQGFSTAPAEEALEALRDKLPMLQSELGVQRFVSKWDENALRGVPEVDRIDVTDRLVAELFTPTPRQRKVLDAMKRNAPLPLETAERLIAEGRL